MADSQDKPDEFTDKELDAESIAEALDIPEDIAEHIEISDSDIYDLLWRWADFHIYIVDPIFDINIPPIVILPAKVEESDELEHVYSIVDTGFCLSTSRGEEPFATGMSMCKLHYTIEKMVAILIERLKSGGVDKDKEVKIAFSGFESAQRKGFESIINLVYNVVVTNFEPGLWGERYLDTVRRMSEKGYGYPLEAPRDGYRHSHAKDVGGGPKR